MRLAKIFWCGAARISTEGQGMGEEQGRDLIRAHMRTRFGLSEEQIDSMLPSFMDTLAGYLEKLSANFAAGEEEEVGRVAHTAKGALLNLGLHEQAGLAKKIELGAKSGRELGELESDFKKLTAGLESLFD